MHKQIQTLKRKGYSKTKERRGEQIYRITTTIQTKERLTRTVGSPAPLGKILKMSDHDMKVTGVIKKVPKNSHIQFDYAFSAENMRQWRESKLDSWEYLQFATYIKLHPEARQQEVCEKINQLVRKNFSRYKVKFGLQPLKRIHLRSTAYDSWMIP